MSVFLPVSVRVRACRQDVAQACTLYLATYTFQFPPGAERQRNSRRYAFVQSAVPVRIYEHSRTRIMSPIKTLVLSRFLAFLHTLCLTPDCSPIPFYVGVRDTFTYMCALQAKTVNSK